MTNRYRTNHHICHHHHICRHHLEPAKGHADARPEPHRAGGGGQGSIIGTKHKGAWQAHSVRMESGLAGTL